MWTSLVEHVDTPGWDDSWVSIVDLDRLLLATHPWSLSGGGALDLKKLIEAAPWKPSSVVSSVGIMSVTGEDDFYMLGLPGSELRLRWPSTIRLVEGDVLRDWRFVTEPVIAGWPYDVGFHVVPLEELGAFGRWLSACRSVLNKRRRFGVPMVERGLAWYEWQELYRSKLMSSMSIVFAFKASHNHFVLDRGGKVFKQTAPVVKLPAGATEDEHLALLGVLNSSSACFWLRQMAQHQEGGGAAELPWSWTYEFSGGIVEGIPLPAVLPVEPGRMLDKLSHELTSRLHLQLC